MEGVGKSSGVIRLVQCSLLAIGETIVPLFLLTSPPGLGANSTLKVFASVCSGTPE